MDEISHRVVMAELHALKQHVANTIRKFEAAGVTSILKDDYVALHVLDHRVMEMYLTNASAIAVFDAGSA